MTNQRAIRSVTLAMLLLASLGAWVHAQQNKDAPVAGAAAPNEESKSAKGGAKARPDRPLPTGEAAKAGEEAPASQGLGALGRVLPVGAKNSGVKIPSFKDGIPSSTVRAETMTRLDDENLFMESMDIRLYGKTHDEDVRIRLITAGYHMPSQILSSDKRARVTRSDFDLQGDSMIFDTRTRQGTMTGNVRMVIADAGSLGPQKKDDSEAADGDKPAETDKNAPDDGKPSVDQPAAPSPAAPTSTTPSNEKK